MQLAEKQKPSEKQKKYLRSLAHGRDPVVLLGARSTGDSGLSAAAVAEMEVALKAHELVKVRARVGSRDERNAMFASLAERTGSTLVQRIGNVGVFYRPHRDKPRIILPAE
ncbi:hypothetical protein ACG33_06835 [Steroidobacter denitrificans]|uniref:CRM domain-containing protein n=1 Tax=Steroidobacter denitrificans TaxID=465721 RepID=A0A127FB35_STEDE|nr:YhbY family RNA-binding protein [Steroidobacter denitrificans]AMN46818.1 hypothetical protein ACG33_06835 [Steroidobacter denitrificans]